MKNLIILDSERRKFPVSNHHLKKVYSVLEELYLKITRKFFILPKLKKYTGDEQTLVLAADKETENWLDEQEVSFFRLNEYLTEKEYSLIEQNSVDFVRTLPFRLPELDFKLEEESLFLLDELNLHEAFFLPVIYSIEFIERIIKKEKIDRIFLLDHSSRLGSVQKQFNQRIAVVDKTSWLSKQRRVFFALILPTVCKILNYSLIKTLKKSSRSEKKSKNILFLEGKRGFIYNRQFLEEIKENVIIFHEEKIKEPGFDHIFPSEKISSKARIRLKQLTRIFHKRKSVLKQSGILKKKLCYKQIGLEPIFWDLIDYLFLISYPKSAFYYESFCSLLKEEPIKLIIVLGEGHPNHKIALRLAKRDKISSLFVMHGAFGFYPLLSNMLSDKVALYGKRYGELLVELGNDPQKMVVTGNPAWDYLTGKKFDAETICSQLNLPRNKKIILLATTNMPDERDRLAYAVIKTMASLPQYHLVLKLHPEEEIDYYRGLLKKYKVRGSIFTESSSLHPLISISAVVITAYSTVGLESLLLGKPVIDVNLTNRPYYQDYVAKGVALGVRREGELTKAIQSLVEDTRTRKLLEKNRKRYLYEHAYKQDGRAGERVAKLIKQMIDQTKEDKFKG